MIPAVSIAQERDPLTVGRRLRIAARVAGHAPELLLDVFVEPSGLAAPDVDQQRRPPLEIGRGAIDEEVTGVQPAPHAEPSGGPQRFWFAAGRRHHHRLARHVLVDRVDDLRS
jgi:hypothetical protein